MGTQTRTWPALSAWEHGTCSSARSSEEKKHWNHPALQALEAVARALARGALGKVPGHMPSSPSDKEDSTPSVGVGC